MQTHRPNLHRRPEAYTGCQAYCKLVPGWHRQHRDEGSPRAAWHQPPASASHQERHRRGGDVLYQHQGKNTALPCLCPLPQGVRTTVLSGTLVKEVDAV